MSTREWGESLSTELQSKACHSCSRTETKNVIEVTLGK